MRLASMGGGVALGALTRTLLFAWRIKSPRKTNTLEISPEGTCGG
jgi:hypothetical protein